MGIMKKLMKSGMVGGLAGMAADKAGISVGDLAKNGYFGLTGLALAKKKKEAQANTPAAGAPAMGGRYGVTDRGENTKEFKKGGKISAAEAVHKHERAKHKGQPLTKLAKGGSASKRGDGCATKGKTKGRFV
jgi:hypothetical protein